MMAAVPKKVSATNVLLATLDGLPSSSFVARKLNKSTFLVVEDDAYGEQPYIFVKLYPHHVLISDTGCNAPRRSGLVLTSLRKYLETFPISTNSGRPLNPQGQKKYVIVCSHCHYDHILGIPQFESAKPIIVASGFDRSFLSEGLPEHSLCKYIHVPTPSYTISKWADHTEYFSVDGKPMRIQFLQTPGHTPDSLSWYDLDEHYLYVGDTFYDRHRNPPIPELPGDSGQVPGLPAPESAIAFSGDGDLVHYMASLYMLLSFTRHRNTELCRRHVEGSEAPRVKLACAHLTYDADAETDIGEVQSLFIRIIAGDLPVVKSGERRGIVYDYWCENEKARFSVMAPRNLMEKARRHFKVT